MRKKILISIVFTFLWVFVVSSIHAKQAKNLAFLETVQKAIIANQANWKAGETPLSKLTPEQKRAMLGALYLGNASPEVLAEIKTEEAPSLEGDLPPTFDWRNYGGADWTTPIKNQGQCGSCWAFATMAGVEAREKIIFNPVSNPDYSEQYLVSCSNAGDCDGGYGFKALEWMRKIGVPDEVILPYQAIDLFVKQKRDINKNLVQIHDWHWAGGTWDSTDVDLIKMEIMSDGPVSTYMDIYEDFYNTYENGIYEYVSGKLLGGHLVCIIGWNDNTDNDDPSCWIVKNSWGTGWGEEGYFRIIMGENEASIEIQTTCADIGE